jgi:prephenate dehydrogenase
VLVATPVAQFSRIFQAIAPHLATHTVITDGGSTKRDVVTAARAAFGDRFPQFVPAHPIAGTEHSGAGAAFAELFEQRKVVIAPESDTDLVATARVRAFWEATGATVVEMSAARHDAIFAAVSHLPHLLAFGLVEELAERPDAKAYFDMAASGFRDFTRIAASSPEMWRDIALANRDALLDELRRYRGQVDRIEALLEQRDGDALAELFETARAARAEWGERRS